MVVRAGHCRIGEHALLEPALLAANDRAVAGRVNVGRNVTVDRHHVGAAAVIAPKMSGVLAVAHIIPAEILELLIGKRGDRRIVSDERGDLRAHRGLGTTLASQQ